MKKRNVNVISHRGANLYAPQNTIPAFERAASLGVEGFETDVHVTKDGHVVICHNYDVNETSNGMGRIANMTLEELRSLDFGSYFSPKFKGTPLPTLEEFLELSKKADIKIMNIELKSPKEAETGIVKKTIDAVKDYGLFDRLLISSFDPKLLLEAKEIDPNCKTGFLYSPITPWSYAMVAAPIITAKRIKADAIHPMWNYVTPVLVHKAHKAGIEVNPWTIDSPAKIKYMLRIGVDGIITNCPDRVRAIADGNF